MDKQQDVPQDSDLTSWLSTYGIITVEKLLERYGISLTVENLTRAVKNPSCLFVRLMQVPLRNIFNGLILQQAKDYQVYAQKLFIDYLLSGEANQEGSQVRDDLEVVRKDLASMGEVFHEEDLALDRLIAKSQGVLIKTTQAFNQKLLSSATKLKQAFQHTGLIVHDEQLMVKSLYTLLCEYDSKTRLPSQHEVWFKVESIVGQSFDLSLCQLMRDEVEKLNQIDAETESALQAFREQSLGMTENIKKFRQDFSSIIIKANEMLAMLGGYNLDIAQLAMNQRDLYFDAKLGEKA